MAADIAFYFKVFGVLAFIFSPLALIGRVAVFSFHHSDQLRKSSSPLSTRHWSPFARERLRNYCEVEHVFQQRLNHGRKPASRYVASFNSEFAAIWARFLSFIVGGFLMILVALGILYEDEFLFSDLTPGHSVTFWLGILGALLAILHSFIPEENTVLDRSSEFRDVVKHIHYFPDHWKGKEHSLDVYDEFNQLFQFKGITLVEELLGLALFMPYILFFRLPQCSQAIVDFFGDNTYERDGVGHVCSVAQLDKVGDREATGIEESMMHSGNVYPHSSNQFILGCTQLFSATDTYVGFFWSALPAENCGELLAADGSVNGHDCANRTLEHSHGLHAQRFSTCAVCVSRCCGALQSRV